MDNTSTGHYNNCSTTKSNAIFMLSVDLYGDMFQSYDFHMVIMMIIMLLMMIMMTIVMIMLMLISTMMMIMMIAMIMLMLMIMMLLMLLMMIMMILMMMMIMMMMMMIIIGSISVVDIFIYTILYYTCMHTDELTAQLDAVEDKSCWSCW